MFSKRLAVFTSALVVCGVVIGCTQEADDEAGIGTEEAALKDPTTGEPTCSGKKVLICHIPPGNPANAHDICVGAPAVAAHVKNHGDAIGACAPSSPPPATDAGAPSDGGSDAPQGDDVILR